MDRFTTIKDLDENRETYTCARASSIPIFFLFSDKILIFPIFQGNSYFFLFLTILPLILAFYSLFITIISRENIP